MFNSYLDQQHRSLLTANEVMLRLRYKSASSFFQWVHASGVPHIKINARKMLFEAGALEAFLQRRVVGKHPEPILGNELLRSPSVNGANLKGGNQ